MGQWEEHPPPINKCISKAPRTQCGTCLFSTLVLNLQLLVRSTAIESHLPSGTASHIPRPPFCFAEPPSSFKSRRGPNCTPRTTGKVPGVDPQTTARGATILPAPPSSGFFSAPLPRSPFLLGERGGRTVSQNNPFGEKGWGSRWLAGVKPPLGDVAGSGTSCRGPAHRSNKGAPRGEAEPEDNPALPSVSSCVN